MREPWLIGGDFNSRLNSSKRQGGQSVLPAELLDFIECDTKCQVQDMLSRGVFFTWNNKKTKDRRVYSKIYRTLVNELWICDFSKAVTWFKEELFSDHTPMVISFTQS